MAIVDENPRTRRRQVIGRNIRRAREARGLTQEQLAQRLSRHRHHLSDWEKGKHEPRAETIEEIARVLDIPAWTLFQPQDEDIAG